MRRIRRGSFEMEGLRALRVDRPEKKILSPKLAKKGLKLDPLHSSRPSAEPESSVLRLRETFPGHDPHFLAIGRHLSYRGIIVVECKSSSTRPVGSSVRTCRGGRDLMKENLPVLSPR